jgi:F-type H+-transporting ATPase subunit b
MLNYEEIAKWSDILSAILFLAVLVWLWMKYIAPAVMNAQANQNRQLAEAERHRDEAKAALELLRQEIEGAKHDAQLIEQRAADQAKHEAEVTVNEAKEAGERALRSAQGELARARAAAREQLREELASKALELARREAETRVDGGVNAKLVDRFVASLEHGARN